MACYSAGCNFLLFNVGFMKTPSGFEIDRGTDILQFTLFACNKINTVLLVTRKIVLNVVAVLGNKTRKFFGFFEVILANITFFGRTLKASRVFPILSRSIIGFRQFCGN